MGKMARGATFGLDYGVFMLKRPGYFSVALGAGDILLCGRPQRPLSKAAVRLVAVSAENYSLNYLVMEMLGELWPLIFMALKAELRLSDFEEMFRLLRVVDAMAANAARITPAMRR